MPPAALKLDVARRGDTTDGYGEAIGPHVLVLPSEEYLPERAPLAGIFQQHQIDAMRSFGQFNFGVISIRLRYSVTMYARALAHALAGRRVDNELGNQSPGSLISDGAKRLFAPQLFFEEDNAPYPVVRAQGLYLTPPSPHLDHHWWVRAGWQAFDRYSSRFGRPDLIHAHNAINAGLLAERINRRTGIPFVLTEHSSYYHQGLVPGSLKRGVATVFSKAAAALVVSETLRESVEKFLGPTSLSASALSVMPNVLPPGFEDTDEIAVYQGGGQPFSFLCVASHLPIKGLDTLLRAFSLLVQHNANCRLRMVGQGPLSAQLHQQARDLGIGEQVDFLGLLSSASVRREMLASNALVVSSRYETFGVVAIEAMACGLPVVSTKCGGPEEVITETTGLLAESNSAESLAQAMSRLIETHERYQPTDIRSSAVARYGRAAFGAQLSAIYRTALAARTPVRTTA